jgi:hypothetical protein
MTENPAMRELVDRLRRTGQRVVVFTARPAGEVRAWLDRQGWPDLEVTNVKSPDFKVMLDDRALNFSPDMLQLGEGLAAELAGFKAWWEKRADTRGVAKAKREKPTLFWRCEEPERAAVTKAEAEGVDGKVRLGACYMRAAYYVMDRPDDVVKLVHGTIEIGGGIPISHAWVELSDQPVVYDGVQGQFYTKSGYYRAMRAVPEQTYTPREAMDKMLETKRFGPWGPSAGIGK